MTTVLRSYALFEDFNDEELAAVCKGLINRPVAKGEVLIEEGSEGHSLFILQSGSADVTKKTDDQKLPLISRLMPGSLFGEISMLGHPPRTAKVVANEPSTVLELPYAHVEKLVRTRPELGVKIYRTIALSLMQKVGKTTQDLISLIASSRMAALGEMTSGISHEINNPMATIGLLAESIEERAQEDKPDTAAIAEDARKVRRNVDRIGKIIKGLRTVVRDAEDDPLIPVSIREILEDTRSFCESRFRDHQIALNIEGVPLDLKVSARGAQLCQVLMNLLNNAHDAIKDLKDRWVKITLEQTPRTVRILVTDSGSGVPQEVRERMFHPFFTTKPNGKGTGLGLSISRQIMAKHGGNLEIDQSRSNTCFILTLPN